MIDAGVDTSELFAAQQQVHSSDWSKAPFEQFMTEHLSSVTGLAFEDRILLPDSFTSLCW